VGKGYLRGPGGDRREGLRLPFCDIGRKWERGRGSLLVRKYVSFNSRKGKE
jgi:hypothetical protein